MLQILKKTSCLLCKMSEWPIGVKTIHRKKTIRCDISHQNLYNRIKVKHIYNKQGQIFVRHSQTLTPELCDPLQVFRVFSTRQAYFHISYIYLVPSSIVHFLSIYYSPSFQFSLVIKCNLQCTITSHHTTPYDTTSLKRYKRKYVFNIYSQSQSYVVSIMYF